MNASLPLRFALVGTARIGTLHARTLARIESVQSAGTMRVRDAAANAAFGEPAGAQR